MKRCLETMRQGKAVDKAVCPVKIVSVAGRTLVAQTQPVFAFGLGESPPIPESVALFKKRSASSY
jgi:hypothetical protein